MRQFIRCDYCDSKIYLGNEMYQLSGRSGCYCSGECFAADHAEITTLTAAEAENCFKELLEEDEVQSDIEEDDTKTATLVIDGKEFTVNLTKKQLKDLVPEYKSPYRELDDSCEGIYIGSDGKVYFCSDSNSSHNQCLYEYGNLYSNQERAKVDARANRLLNRLRRAAYNSRYFNNRSLVNIKYNTCGKEITAENIRINDYSAGVILFGDIDSANSFINDNKAELLWYFEEYIRS